VTVIFLGPSAPKAEIERIVRTEIRPPVAQGDVFRAVEQGASAIGIVDGYFNSTPAVWHKEIVWAMSRGIPVYGAASMGALRAAELAPLGMRGIGWVYEAFASGELEDDDEVAILHAPESFGYAALTEAMVNVRRTLLRAEAEAVLAAHEARTIARAAKALFYAERHWPEILAVASAALPAERLDAFSRWLPHGRVDVKRADAIALARTMHRELDETPEAVASPSPCPAVALFEPTALVENALRSACGGTSVDASHGAPSAILDEMRLCDPAWHAREERALLEALALERASKAASTLDEASLTEAVARFRSEHGLRDATDVAGFLASRQISEEQALQLLARDARVVQAAADLRTLTFRLLADRLPLHAAYDELAKRAAEKQRLLQMASQRGALPSAALDDRAVFAWYRDRTTGGRASDAESADFVRALRAEYDFVTLWDAEKFSESA
jgi:hypothetical protein